MTTAKATKAKLGKKGKAPVYHINFRVRTPDIRDEFHAAAELLGSTASNILHMHVVKVINEVRSKDPQQFQLVLETFRADQKAAFTSMRITSKVNENGRAAVQNSATRKTDHRRKPS